MLDAVMRIRRLTRLEYDRLIEAGFFQPGDSVQLLGGQLMVGEPQAVDTPQRSASPPMPCEEPSAVDGMSRSSCRSRSTTRASPSRTSPSCRERRGSIGTRTPQHCPGSR